MYSELYYCPTVTTFPLYFLYLLVELLGNCGDTGVPDLVSVLRTIASENIPNLPPGGGLASK